MKVLLAIDSSDLSDVLVSEFERRPWPSGTTVCVLTIVDMFGLTLALGYPQRFVHGENEAALSLVERVAERLKSKGFVAESRVLEGYPSTAIVDHAAEWGADLLFVGSHGHSGFVRFFLGSVAKAVVHNASCSVGIIRVPHAASEAARPAGMKLLLATDGSEFSEAAASSIARRPWPRESEVKVISVADVFVPAMDPWYTTGEVTEQIRQASMGQAETAVMEAGKILKSDGLAVSGEVLTGSPKARIVDEADRWGADLVVVGSHGRRGITRLLLGNVSEAVAMRAHCSVEVIREQRAAGEQR